MNLCLICLRTDKILKLATNVLQDFYEDLCDFTVGLTMVSSYYYCRDCEYILLTFYKFKEKCVMALKIYRKWLSIKSTKKEPINLLHSKLSLSSLRVFRGNVVNFSDLSSDSQSDVIVEKDITEETNTKEIKLECDQTCNTFNNGKLNDTLKADNTEQHGQNNKTTNGQSTTDEIETNRTDTGEHLSENELNNTILDKTNFKNSKKNRKVAVNTENDLEDLIINIKEDGDDSSKKSSNKKKILPKRLVNRVTKKKNNAELNTKVTRTKGEVEKKVTRTKGELDKKVTRTKKAEKININNKLTTKQQAYFDKAKATDVKYDSVFDVEYLTTQELKIEEFDRRKTYECYLNAKHRCEVCFQVFNSAKYLEYHTNKWHNESGGTKYCSLCKIWSPKTSNHPLTHTMVFKCKLCPLVTYHRESMHNHFEQHKGKQYTCEECKITYKSKSSYRSHIGKVHRQGCNICAVCGRGFRSPSGLSIHLAASARCAGGKNAALADGGVRCDECDVTFASQEVFEAHTSDVHEPSGRPYIINSAGLPEPRIYVTKKSRKKKNVRRKHVHTCRVCNKAGISFYWLRLHFKREHPNEDIEVLYADKHLCDICGTGFSTVYALRDHMNRHTGARPHACGLCAKSFRSSSLARAHRVRHFPSALACALCGKRFKTQGNLYWHMKVHTGEKNHKCDICGKAFRHRANLAEHIRGVHFYIRRPKKGGKRGAGGADGNTTKTSNIVGEPEMDSNKTNLINIETEVENNEPNLINIGTEMENNEPNLINIGTEMENNDTI